jgi:hypothetical protein
VAPSNPHFGPNRPGLHGIDTPDHDRIVHLEDRVDEHDRQIDELVPAVMRIDKRTDRMERLLGHPGPDPEHPLDGADGVLGDLGMIAKAVAYSSSPPPPMPSYPPPRGDWGDITATHLQDPDKIVKRVHHAERGVQRWKTSTWGIGTLFVLFEVARETGLLASIFRALAHAVGG